MYGCFRNWRRLSSHPFHICKSNAEDNPPMLIDRILIETMATFPFSQNGEIDQEAFFKEVERVVEIFNGSFVV